MDNFSAVKEELVGIVFNIEHFHIHDGSGIRTNVFLKGCHLRCPWCCNPESQKMEPEIAVHLKLCKLCLECVNKCHRNAISFSENKLHLNRNLCDGCGVCIQSCPHDARQLYGQMMSVEEVVKEIEKDVLFYNKSGGGVTLSGGEPSLQPEFARAILKACKEKYINTAIETCGAVNWDTFWHVVEYADEILFDIKHTDPDLFAEISPVPFINVKQNLQKLIDKGKSVILRCPLIPNYNDNLVHITKIIELANDMYIEKIDILPFHQLGKYKYNSLDKVYNLEIMQLLNNKWIQEVEEMLSNEGFVVSVGG